VFETWIRELEEEVKRQTIDANDLERCIGCGGRAAAVFSRYTACGCHDDVQYGCCGSCRWTPSADKAIEEKMMAANIARLGARQRAELIARVLKQDQDASERLQ
jgi:hypothetical protein